MKIEEKIRNDFKLLEQLKKEDQILITEIGYLKRTDKEARNNLFDKLFKCRCEKEMIEKRLKFYRNMLKAIKEKENEKSIKKECRKSFNVK